MSFLHPEFLYYMLPPLFILFGFLLTQKEAYANYFTQEVMDRLRVSTNTLTLKARNALFLLMGVFIIIALAEPVIKEGTVEVKAKSADIMIAIDISDSMLASDIYPNRLEAAKQKVLTLLDEKLNERIGIVAFAKNSYLVSPLSFDASAVAFLLRQLDTSSITEKGTDFLSLLDVVNKIQKDQDKKYLLLLSDGGDKSDFSDEIELAKKHNITLFILGIATKKGAPIKLQDGTFIKYKGDIIISKLNEKIADLALKTGGVYIEGTTSSKDIKTMFKEIIDKSDQKELKSEKIQRYTPLFYYPLGMSLILLLIATSSIGGRKKSSAASVFILFSLFLFNTQHAQAAILDFMELRKAKEAYKVQKYEEAAEIYKEYAQNTQNSESYFNAGNAFYKQGKYKEAIEAYEKAVFDDENKKAENLSNLGNAYAKEANQESLQKAVEAYEKSLKIKEDKETRENLQEVKKFLEKQKKDNKEKSDKEKSDKKNQKEDENGDKSQDSEDGEKKESDKDQEKNSDKEKNSQNKESKEKDPGDMKSKKEKEQDSRPDNNQTDQKSKKEKVEKLEKEDENSSQSQSTTPQKIDKESMSDEEEKKWIEQLGTHNSTYLYKLNSEKPKSSSLDEKPW
ncbi:VWA domain-containing protein [Sulfurimonas sp. CVO]|uniref:VWA domain-containing protein n=1 Tax=Sulfurimonas sp. CVO TaxID=2283483 RepID=UPI00132F0EA7|nr:VWA domain-containing protein [Sulfurimonas sp. CVO]QHG91523.1 VWA domain-containing protein [Sulfurimonas sp. CVO]